MLTYSNNGASRPVSAAVVVVLRTIKNQTTLYSIFICFLCSWVLPLYCRRKQMKWPFCVSHQRRWMQKRKKKILRKRQAGSIVVDLSLFLLWIIDMFWDISIKTFQKAKNMPAGRQLCIRDGSGQFFTPRIGFRVFGFFLGLTDFDFGSKFF